jgi:hypothetical protein
MNTTVSGRSTLGSHTDRATTESVDCLAQLDGAHIDPAIWQLLNEPDLERVTYLLKDIYIRHPAAQRIEQFRAPSGQGKTHVLRAFQRLYPETHQPEDLLPWWRDPPLLIDMRESPEALAHAWLGDTRVAPDSLPLATDGMMTLRGSGRRTWLKSAAGGS